MRPVSLGVEPPKGWPVPEEPLDIAWFGLK
jgi:hypothetical protein